MRCSASSWPLTTSWSRDTDHDKCYLGIRSLVAAGALPRLPGPDKTALVFGREDCGFFPEELSRCSAVCSLPMGRFQESLSLTHALSIVLAQLFDWRRGQLPPQEQIRYDPVAAAVEAASAAAPRAPDALA